MKQRDHNSCAAKGIGETLRKALGYFASILILGMAALGLAFLAGAIRLFEKGPENSQKFTLSDFSRGSLYRAYWVRKLQ